jgi:adhesin/invasin
VGSTSLSGIVFKSQTPVPQVKVTDVDGNPVAGTAVTFTGSTGSTVSGSSKTTDPAGLASPDGWILGTAAGSYTLTATASGLAAAIVTAVARADVPTSMTIVVGNTQTSPAGRPVAVEPTVKVTDMHGNPVSGIDIIFEVASGGGAAVGRRATTNALGLATVGGWTLGDAVGANTLVASVQTSGLAVPSVTFTATAAAGAAATMTAGAGQSQTAVAGAAVGAAPTVVVRDARGNPVAGVVVTFLVTSGGGSTTRASDTTLATGVATAGSWVLGGTVGPQTLVARSTNLPDVTFTATATAGAAARLSAFSTQAQSGVSVGTALTLSQRPAVRVTDTEGNPVSGVPVAFSVDADGYSGFLTGGSTTTTVLTNSNGIATVGAWTMPTAVGTATAVATVSGIAETVTFSVTTSFGAISRLRITANSSSTLLVTAGGTASVITISALDAFGNVVTSYNGAKSVTFSGASAAPGGTIPTANGVDFGTASELTFLNGVATTALRLYRAQSASVSVSDGTNSSGVTGALSATVRAAAESAIVRETPSSAAQSISGVLARSVTVKLVDVYGNGIAGVDVTVVASHGSLASPTGTTASNGTVTFSWTNALSTTAVSQTLSFNTETISGTLLYTYTVSP